jgi:hypothetical protein
MIRQQSIRNLDPSLKYSSTGAIPGSGNHSGFEVLTVVPFSEASEFSNP